jgi:phosphatidate cytidylyltransferase
MSDRLFLNTKGLTNFQLRLITAIVLLPIATLASFVGDIWFLLMLLPVMSVGMLEFYVMDKKSTMQGSSLTGIPTGIIVTLAFFSNTEWVWQIALLVCVVATLILEMLRQPKQFRRALVQVAITLCGILYIAFPTAFLVSIRNIAPHGLVWLFVVYAITWGTDTFAYVAGRTYGKTKLAPLISPNKTVEGAIGGIFGAWIPTFLILIVSGIFQPILIPLVLIGPFLAVSGDLFESALKRFFNVKDSYVEGFNIFPGHGGVLDRIDALVWVTTWIFLYLYMIGIV